MVNTFLVRTSSHCWINAFETEAPISVLIHLHCKLRGCRSILILDFTTKCNLVVLRCKFTCYKPKTTLFQTKDFMTIVRSGQKFV